MPFKTFSNWLFDGMKSSPIPKPKSGVDILKYNSPITHTFALSIFMRNGYLNKYLDEYFNNINLRYLSREELFKFLKKCVIDFKVNRKDMVYYSFKRRDKLVEALQYKLPYLKINDISLLCDIIEKADDKEAIYDSLGLSTMKKKKIKTGKKIEKKGKVPLKEFLAEHFSILK